MEQGSGTESIFIIISEASDGLRTVLYLDHEKKKIDEALD